ncbi:MAG: hypothetical protein M3X11_11380 [Acidobacteriota bacterium]|nr:hypothetical protein [Acidobacteriota bacterium]
MKRITFYLALAVFACAAIALSARDTSAIKWTAEMKEGKAELKSAGPLAFGPDGILFVADTKAASIIAIATGDTASAAAKPLKVEAINQKIAALLGTSAEEILIQDMAINPVSGNAYLAVSRGRGADAVPVLVRVKSGGQPEVVSLDKVKTSRIELPAAPADAMVGQGNRQSNLRMESITDIGFMDGRVLIAGLSNEEFASTLRAVPFPFKAAGDPTSVEIYHGAHGKFETRAPIRTFAPFKVGNVDHLLAAYTCTPLVQFPISELKAGAKIKGKTIAELGNRNRPIDMIVYQKDGKTYLLMANSSRGVMKITTDQIEKAESITAPVPDKKGLPYETIAAWTGVEQLDRLDAKNAVVLRKVEGGAMTLESLPLP